MTSKAPLLKSMMYLSAYQVLSTVGQGRSIRNLHFSWEDKLKFTHIPLVKNFHRM